MSQIRRMGYFLVVLLLCANAAAMVWKPAPSSRLAGLSSADVPHNVGTLTSDGDIEQPQVVKDALPNATIISRRYGDIDFTLIGGTDRNALHDPRNCLRGAGMQMEDERTETLPGTDVKTFSLHAIGQPGTPSWDTILFYVVDGRIVSSVSSTRLAMLKGMLLGQSKPVILLRFERPLESDPKTAQVNHERLREFAAQMWTELKPKLVKD